MATLGETPERWGGWAGRSPGVAGAEPEVDPRWGGRSGISTVVVGVVRRNVGMVVVSALCAARLMLMQVPNDQLECRWRD
ncbi:MAG: hypothetical protein ACYC91_02730 [Solirubrobacteraceae bacterium]